jgi:hypothetical protein
LSEPAVSAKKIKKLYEQRMSRSSPSTFQKSPYDSKRAKKAGKVSNQKPRKHKNVQTSGEKKKILIEPCGIRKRRF